MIPGLVSICLPTRNRSRALGRSLENLLAQDYEPMEIIISDNDSQDDTEGTCREFARRDSRIRYVRQPRNIGLHGNHNFCLDEAAGEFVCICHDHDERRPEMISRYVEFLGRHPRIGIVCSDWDLIDDSGNLIGTRRYEGKEVTPGSEYIDRTLRTGRQSIGTPGAMVRRAALGDVRFVPDAPIGFGDFPIWCRVAEEWDVGHIHGCLWSWRQNKESHSARRIEEIANDYWINLNGYCDDYLRRWPSKAATVARWRREIRWFLFWLLCYEVALHFSKRGGEVPSGRERTLFEIMDYRLTPEQLESTLTQIRGYRTGPVEHAVYAIVLVLVRSKITGPLGWATRYQQRARELLGLR